MEYIVSDSYYWSLICILQKLYAYKIPKTTPIS